MSENGTIPENKSYELVTEKLVREALRNDKGNDAQLLSWDIKNFTNKGDGYMSVIVNILVKYNENGIEHEESYIAKLNPLRPPSSMSDMADDMFAREPIIFSKVMGSMSKHLSTLGLPPIKTPKFYAGSFEKGREAFLTENLRKQGFVLHDRRKGQDFNHASLVMGELGRFHASSLLLEDPIAPKTFEETFGNLEEPWLDVNNPGLNAWIDILKAQSQSAIKYLKENPKYDICVKWLQANVDSMGQLFIDGLTKSTKPFEVITHGDCWTNNMLFKYNAKNKPEDIRFVDLQGTRKASLASDITTFIFTSLNGEMRTKYLKELLLIYYQSFSKVLILARKPIPFSFKELEDEFEKRKIFGILIGLMTVGGFLFLDEDETWNLDSFTDEKEDDFAANVDKHIKKLMEDENTFKDRFVSLFDDMLASPVFEI
ncbi:UNVERIFIED_CONTAM: hypothetical protein RMT77_000182 [Armadillidium vulgare]